MAMAISISNMIISYYFSFVKSFCKNNSENFKNKSNKLVTKIFVKPLTFSISCGIIIMFSNENTLVTLRAVCQIGIVIKMTLKRTYYYVC